MINQLDYVWNAYVLHESEVINFLSLNQGEIKRHIRTGINRRSVCFLGHQKPAYYLHDIMVVKSVKTKVIDS